MIIDNHQTIKNNKDFLVKCYAGFIYNKITQSDGELYSIGFYIKKEQQVQEWIKSEPSSSIARLRNKNQCVYCDIDLNVKYGVGDHIVGRELDSALWVLPCCNICNSSKGKKDLIVWWCKMKNRNILDLKKDVFAIYVRAKYKLLEKQGKLNDRPIQEHIDILKQFKGINLEMDE